MRQQAQRWIDTLVDEKAYYLPEQVDAIYGFAADNLVYPHGPAQGQPVKLAPYQLWVMAMMNATYVSEERRLYTELLWITGKGAAKTITGSVECLVYLAMDAYSRPGTMVPVICRDGVQAKDVIFRDIGMLVESSDSFGRYSIQRERTLVCRIENMDNRAYAKAFTREANTAAQQGGSNKRGFITGGLVLVDEYSDIPSSEAIVMAKRGSKGGQVQTWYMSNGGGYKDYPAYEHYRKACQVLDGAETADGLCPVICEFDNADDWEDPNEWLKANPMLDFGVPMIVYEQATEDARVSEWTLGEHLRLMGAQWVEAKEGWINLDLWAACEDDSLKIDDFKGKAFYIATDLSKLNDLCSYITFAPDGEDEHGDPKYIGFLRAFTCEGASGLIAKGKKDKIDYARLEKQGHIVVCRRPTIDYGLVAETMAVDIGLASSAVACYDTQYKQDFDQAAMGRLPADLPQFAHPQSPKAHINYPDKLAMSRSIAYAEELVLTKRIRFVPNPLMRISLGNALINVQAGSFRHFARRKQIYDPAVSLAMVAGLVHLPEAAKRNASLGDNPVKGMNAMQLAKFMYEDDEEETDA